MQLISKKQIVSAVNNLARFGILVMAVYYLFLKLTEDQTDVAFYSIAANSSIKSIMLLLLSLLLMPMNWLCEARKWQKLSGVDKIFDSLKSVLLGLLARQFLSFIGDFSGRLLSNSNKDKKQLVGAFFINSFSQMFISVVFGLFGCYVFFISNASVGMNLKPTLLLAISVLIISSFVIVLRKRIVFAVNKHIEFFATYKLILLVEVFVLSLVRYSIFVLQFFLIFKVFNPNMSNWLLVGGITFIFLSKTVIPTFNAIGDLGIREFSAVLFFSQFGYESLPIVLASITIWLINILLPSLVGVVFLPRIRLIRT